VAHDGDVTSPKRRSLLRHHDFRQLFCADVFAQVGTQLSTLAIPVMAVRLLGAEEFEMGLLGTAEFLAFLLIALPAGVWVDRWRKQRVLVSADLVRAGALLTLPLAWWLEMLSFPQLLVVSLVAVVGLAKALSPAMEAGIAWAGAPKAVIGVVIAALVLLPEAVAAIRAARGNRLQTSLNLALGSALASIGLTIPVVAMVSIGLGIPLTLGLEPKETVLLALTVLAGVVTLGTGRTTVLQGIVHLVILAAFLFLSVVP
jgi:hypothetical protein